LRVAAAASLLDRVAAAGRDDGQLGGHVDG
jgi:hypothetical protein